MKTIYTLLLVCTFSIFCNAQKAIPSEVQDTLSIFRLAVYDAQAMIGGVAHTYTSPTRWKGNDWVVAGTIVGGTAVLYFADNDVSTFARNQRDDVPNVLNEFGERFGSPQVAYGLTAGTYLFGLFTKNEKIRKTGALMTSSAVAAGFLQTVLKTTVGRARPTSERGDFDFRPYSGDSRFRSFPSGHTILAVTVAHSIAKQFDNVWIKAGIYTVGSIVPLQRLWKGAHWLTDVALSSALSILIVDSVDSYMNQKNLYPDGSKKKGITWNVNLGLGRAGISGSF